MARVRAIDPDSYGRGDQVFEVAVLRRVQFGGFEAMLVDSLAGQVWVSALKWKGPQPRLILSPTNAGYADWRKLLDASPALTETIRFVGAPEAAKNVEDQWLTHGPSRLLG